MFYVEKVINHHDTMKKFFYYWQICCETREWCSEYVLNHVALWNILKFNKGIDEFKVDFHYLAAPEQSRMFLMDLKQLVLKQLKGIIAARSDYCSW